MKKLLFGIIFIDQFIKQIVVHYMTPGESVPVIAGVFHLTFVENPGAAFGMLRNQQWFFILAAGVFILAACCFYYKIARESAAFRYGCMALVGGAAGNLIDRLLPAGTVIDYIDFRVWPVFNFADVAIVLGMMCMVYDILVAQGGERADVARGGSGRRTA